MKDFLGRELNVGDTVVFVTHSRTSSSLNIGKIRKFTPRMATINTEFDTTHKTSDKIVKVEE